VEFVDGKVTPIRYVEAEVYRLSEFPHAQLTVTVTAVVAVIPPLEPVTVTV
jgi:hypothetical protein